MSNTLSDIAIVGAGVIGLSLARRLALEGLTVTVLEQGQPGREASFAAAGILAAQADMERDNPLNEVSLASRNIYPSFVEALMAETGIEIEFSNSGLIYLAFSEMELKELLEKHKWQHVAGLPFQKLLREELSNLEPNLNGEISSGLFFPREGCVDNVKLVEALRATCVLLKVNIVSDCRVLSIKSNTAKVRGVETVRGFWPADGVVVAAGSWSGLIDIQPLRRLPVIPIRGQMMAVRHRQPMFKRIIYSSGTYLVPRKDGTTLLGSTIERDGYEKKTTLNGMAQIVAGSLAVSSAMRESPIVGCWAGLRPYVEGGLPLMGAAGISGLYIATGHYRNGLLLAPITAELMTELIVSGRTPKMLSPFDPRILNQTAHGTSDREGT